VNPPEEVIRTSHVISLLEVSDVPRTQFDQSLSESLIPKPNDEYYDYEDDKQWSEHTKHYLLGIVIPLRHPGI